MGTTKSFSLKGCFIFVGPTRLGDFADGDAIAMEEVVKFETVTGADGTTIYGFNPNKDRAATIRLMQAAASYRELMIQAQAQWALASSGVALVPTPFLYTDPSTGTVVNAGLIFMNEPQISVGNLPGPIEIKVSLTNPKIAYGMANIV